MATLPELSSAAVLRGGPPPSVVALFRDTVLCARTPAGRLTRFRLGELECYCPDDPYTHGFGGEKPGCEQMGPAGRWYFHRAGKNATGNYRGGTFKGLDITCAPEGSAGGILIRTIAEMQAAPPPGPISGPSRCVDRLLAACGAESIQALVARPDWRDDAFDQAGCLFLAGRRPTDPPISDLILATPRVGLKPPAEDSPAAALKRSFCGLPARFTHVDAAVALNTQRKEVLLALRDRVGVEKAVQLTGLSPFRFY